MLSKIKLFYIIVAGSTVYMLVMMSYSIDKEKGNFRPTKAINITETSEAAEQRKLANASKPAKPNISDKFVVNDSDPVTFISGCSTAARRTNDTLPMIYFITPTHIRSVQLADMTRLANTLMHVVNLHWLIGEDSHYPNPLIIDMVNKSGVSYTYQLAPRPGFQKRKHRLGRGVSGRRAGIKWLIQNNITDGVMYMGDDDNSYDIKLFDEMRYIKKVAMWPVGAITRWGISSPIIKAGKIVGFHDGSIRNRKFPVDMAGFAVGLKYLFYEAKRIFLDYKGHIETTFLEALGINIDEIEIKAENCTKIYVWHTQTQTNFANRETWYNKLKNNPTNLGALVKYL